LKIIDDDEIIENPTEDKIPRELNFDKKDYQALLKEACDNDEAIFLTLFLDDL